MKLHISIFVLLASIFSLNVSAQEYIGLMQAFSPINYGLEQYKQCLNSSVDRETALECPLGKYPGHLQLTQEINKNLVQVDPQAGLEPEFKYMIKIYSDKCGLFLNGPIDLSRKLFVMSEFQTTDKGGPIWIFNRVLEKDQNSHILYSGKESELASQEQLMIVCDMGVFEKDLTTEVFTNIPGLMYSTEPEIEYNW